MMGHVLVSLDELEQELAQRPQARPAWPALAARLAAQGAMSPASTPPTAKRPSSGAPCRRERRAAAGTGAGPLDALAQNRTNFQAHARLLFERQAFEARPDSTLLPVLERGYAQVIAGPLPRRASLLDRRRSAAAVGTDTILIGPPAAAAFRHRVGRPAQLCRPGGILAETARTTANERELAGCHLPLTNSLRRSCRYIIATKRLLGGGDGTIPESKQTLMGWMKNLRVDLGLLAAFRGLDEEAKQVLHILAHRFALM